MMTMRTSVRDHHDLDHEHDNHHRQFPIPSSQRGEADATTPATSTPPLFPHRTNDIYDSTSGFHHVFSGGSAPLQQLFLHPPNISPSAYTAFKSPGGNMATSVGFPFTNAQWKELERQAMIYKYMVSSIPVPLDLLLPITTRSSSAAWNELKVRYANGRDPEPGRCKRTDGKKWRCSRDVAPDQKYCERHMHRGRPRSRKHVELHLNNNNNNNNNPQNRRTRQDQQNINGSATTSFTTSNSSQPESQTHFLGVGGASTLLPYHPSPVFQPLPPPTDKEQRSLEWMMMMKGGGGGGEEQVGMAASDPRWLHLMQQTRLEMTTQPSSSSIFTQEEPFLNLNSYANFTTTGEDDDDDHDRGRDCSVYLNSHDVVSLQNQTSSEPPPPPPPQRSFIDAWSSQTQDNDKSSPSSSLTLSMGGQAQIMSHANDDSNKSCHFTSCSWGVGSSSLGGPLGEVLRPSAASDPPSPFTGNGNSGSPPATVVSMSASSPSGVLPKTFAASSLSDSSGCSSPALGSSKSKPEISLL